jgi:hypothetical protein
MKREWIKKKGKTERTARVIRILLFLAVGLLACMCYLSVFAHENTIAAHD